MDVEEAYLREDISCGSQLCSICAQTATSLNADATHYAIPDPETLATFLEVFELPDLSNYILLASVLRKLTLKLNLRKVARLHTLYRDRRRHCYLFDDIHCLYTDAAGCDASSVESPLMVAAKFYHDHLDHRMPIIVVSDVLTAINDKAEVEQLLQFLQLGTEAMQGRSHSTQGVQVLSALDYFATFWGHRSAVTDLVESLVQAQQAQQASRVEDAGGLYSRHLAQQDIEDGLSSGKLLQGVLHVSKRNPFEALVQVGSSTEAPLGHMVRVAGRAAMNRAMDGDVVAVRLLPVEQGTADTATTADDTAGGSADLAAAAADTTAADADYGAELLGGNGGGEGVADEPPCFGASLEASAADSLIAGEVVGILQRHMRDIVACLAQQDEEALSSRRSDAQRQEAVLCTPIDRRLPYIRIRTRQVLKLIGQRFVLRIDNWERSSRYPLGHVVKVLGPINNLRAETEAVLVQCGIHWQPFCKGALAELPDVGNAADWRPSPAERANRRDCTGPDYFIVSIDPPGCTDVDDAMHVRQLADGCIEVGVHIADVSFFVRQAGMLDGEARDRCTSVYLTDRRLDMLPSLLSEQLCSLRGGVERYAVSVIWTLQQDTLDVKDVWFGRTIIRSRHQLHYQQAQDILDGRPPAPGDELPAADRQQLVAGLALLQQLTAKFKARRVADGALELSSAELRFQTDAAGQPVDVVSKQKVPMMDIVAEMMIFANAEVAVRIATAYPGCALLRNHPPPRQEAFEQVRELIESPGEQVDLTSNQSLARALQAACRRAGGAAVAELIMSLTTRAMSEAKYFSTGAAAPGSSGAYHYGLALPYYTHFTSPIRRYADIVVHRQLLAALSGPDSPAPLPHAELAAAAQVMNNRHRDAKAAQKECTEMYLLMLLHAKPHVEAAIVVDVQGQAVEVFVPKYHLRGRIKMLDSHGVVRLPLLHEGEETKDPFAEAQRRHLRLHTPDKGTLQVLDDCVDGSVVWQVATWQQVWVRLAADGSRAHGPKLTMRLVDAAHPMAAAAALQQAATPNKDVHKAAALQPGKYAPLLQPQLRPRPQQQLTVPGYMAGAAVGLSPEVSAVGLPEDGVVPVTVGAAHAAAGSYSGAEGTGSTPLPSAADDLEVATRAALTALHVPGPLTTSEAAPAPADSAVYSRLLRKLQAQVAVYEAKLAVVSPCSSRRDQWHARLLELQAKVQELMRKMQPTCVAQQ